MEHIEVSDEDFYKFLCQFDKILTMEHVFERREDGVPFKEGNVVNILEIGTGSYFVFTGIERKVLSIYAKLQGKIMYSIQTYEEMRDRFINPAKYWDPKMLNN